MLSSTHASASPEAGALRVDTPQPTAPARRQRFSLGVVLAVFWLVLVAVCAATAQWLPIQSPIAVDLYNVESGPSAAHWLGTDSIGRDLLSRLIFGAQTDAIVALGTVVIGCVLGSIVGVVAGYFRGPFDWLMVRALDIILAFPGLVLILALAAFLGPSLRNVTLVIGVLIVPSFARVARATTIQIAQREFILAARSLGATDFRIVSREILPSVLLPVLTLAMLVIGAAIIIEGAISFLGAGIPAPTSSWGNIMALGLGDLAYDPVPVMAPAAAISITVLALNYLAEQIRGAVQVRTSLI